MRILYSCINIVLIYFESIYLFSYRRVSADCTAGEYLVIEENKCKPCERGTYQSKPSQNKCDDCPLGKTTLGLGHIDEADCISEYRLITPYYNYVSSETTAIFRKTIY